MGPMGMICRVCHVARGPPCLQSHHCCQWEGVWGWPLDKASSLSWGQLQCELSWYIWHPRVHLPCWRVPESQEQGLCLFICLAVPGLNHDTWIFSMWDLVPWPGIEPRPPALGTQSLSHWTTREGLGTLSYTHDPRAWLRAWLNRPINTPSSQSGPVERSNLCIRFEAEHSCLSKSLILLKLCFSHLWHVAIIYLICDHGQMLNSLELLCNRYTVSLNPNY